jgi:hypothetical protein
MGFVVGRGSGAGFKTNKPTTTQNYYINLKWMFIPTEITCIIHTLWQTSVKNFSCMCGILSDHGSQSCLVSN